MSEQLPSVAIYPTMQNELLLWLGEIVPDHRVRDDLVHADDLYHRHHAEIRLLLDLVLALPAPAAPLDAEPTPRVRAESADEREFGMGSILR